MMKKKVWFLTLAVFLGACSTTTAPENNSANTATTAETTDSAAKEQLAVTVNVVVEDEAVPELTKDLKVEPGSSVMDVMEENYEIEETDGFLSAIEGYEQSKEDNEWWMYQVNGEDADVGAADFEVHDGDEITWTLTKF